MKVLRLSDGLTAFPLNKIDAINICKNQMNNGARVYINVAHCCYSLEFDTFEDAKDRYLEIIKELEEL
jgi:hypothetical protein